MWPRHHFKRVIYLLCLRTIQLWEAHSSDDRVVCLGLIFLKITNEFTSLIFGAHADGRISLLKGKGIIVFLFLRHLFKLCVNCLRYHYM